MPGDILFVRHATRYVDRLTGIDDRTREDYHREIRPHLSLLQHPKPSRRVAPATIRNVTRRP